MIAEEKKKNQLRKVITINFAQINLNSLQYERKNTFFVGLNTLLLHNICIHIY